MAPSPSAWKPMPSQLEPFLSPPCQMKTLEPIGFDASLMVASPSATIAPPCNTSMRLSARDTRIEVTALEPPAPFLPTLASISAFALEPRTGPGSLTAAGSVTSPAMVTGVPICVTSVVLNAAARHQLGDAQHGLDAERLGPWQAPERRLDDAADHRVVTDAGFERGIGKACVIAETGVGIDFEDEGRIRPIDAEIDPRVTVESEQAPARERKPLQLGCKFRLFRLDAEIARRAEIRLAARRPLGVVVCDQWRTVAEAMEQRFGDWEYFDAPGPFHHRDGEFPSVDIGLGEMLRAPVRASFGDLAGGVGAARDRARVDSERAVLEHGLDDHPQARIEPRPILRPLGRGQAGMSE